ncbi:MAG: motility associated factor glycosyltransferase family protein [Acidobacteriota bacterium]
MSVFTENLSLLRKRNPRLAQIMENHLVKSDYRVEPGKKNLPTIQTIVDGYPAYLHSVYDPIKEAETAVNNMNEKSLVNIIYGTGMGYHILAVLNSQHGKKINIIIEPNIDLLRIFMQTNVATQVLSRPNFYLAVGTLEDIREQMKENTSSSVHHKLSSMDFLILPGFERAYGKIYRSISQTITEDNRLRFFQTGNSAEDTLIGLKNTFANLQYLIDNPGLNLLEGKYRNVPAIIIAAGPSLDKNVHLLKELKGKVLLLSADTILKKLLGLGIIPDIVFTVERDAILFEYFYKEVDIPESLWLMTLNVVDPRTIAKFGKKSIVCTRSTEPLSRWVNDLIGDKGTISAGISVANMAFSVAQYMGANPIVFIGQDLAYSTTGQCHTSDTIYDTVKLDEGMLEWVKDYEGNPIQTTHLWKKFLIWFEQEIAAAQDVTFLDCTEGGALIKGTQIMKLADAINKYMKDTICTPVDDVIKEALESTTKINYQQVQEKLEQMIGVFDTFIDDIKNTMTSSIPRIKGKLADGSERQELDDDLNELEREFNRILTGFHHPPRDTIGFIVQSVFTMTATRLNKLGNPKDLKEFEELLSVLITFYTYAIEIADITKMMMEDMTDYLKTLEGEPA